MFVLNIYKSGELLIMTIKRIKQLFYIHRELGVAVWMAAMACIELLCSLVVDHPWQYLAYAAAALLGGIAALLVRNVIRFEQTYSSN
jgi:hypothetical protein